MTISGMMFLPNVMGREIMERFLARYGDRIVGSIAGFDRILFRGSLLSICHRKGMDVFLASQRVLYKDFGAFVQNLSAGEARPRGKSRRARATSSQGCSGTGLSRRG